MSQECCAKVSSGCCKDVNQNEITSYEDDKKVRCSGSLGRALWVRKFGYLVCIQEILVLTKSESSVRPYVHPFMLEDEKCHTYQLANKVQHDCIQYSNSKKKKNYYWDCMAYTVWKGLWRCQHLHRVGVLVSD